MGTRALVRYTGWRGGVNEYDAPLDVPADQVLVAQNVELQDGALGAKRYGSTTTAMTWGLSDYGIASLIRHTPDVDEAQAELWAVSFADFEGDVVFGRSRPGSLPFETVSPTDALVAPTSAYCRAVNGASLNGKLFLAYDSAEDRLHVWDGTSLRRAGLVSYTLSDAVSSSGAVTDTRKYRGVLIYQAGVRVVSRSEPGTTSAAIALSSEQVTCSMGSPEHATHWELQVASDDDDYATWYVVGQAAIATTITDNNPDLTVLDAAYSEGLFETLPSAKYVLTDENRLILANSWEDEDYVSRIWWTPVLGALDQGDDERLVETSTISSHLDLDRGDGGQITGLGGPLFGSVYVFKETHIYKLVRTGLVNSPYEVIPISKTVGCLKHQSIVLGEDETGSPALYFLSREGPYRLSARGLEFLGTDITTTWDTVNRQAVHVGFGVWHPGRKQVWWWVTEAPYSQPTVRLRFDVRAGVSSAIGVRKGWAIDTGYGAAAHCGVSFAVTPGVDMSYDQVPHYVPSGAVLSEGGWVLRADADGLYTDGDGEDAYQSTVTSAPLVPDEFDTLTNVTGGTLVARTLSGEAPSVRVSVVRDWGLETRSEDVYVEGSHPATAQVLALRQLTCPNVTALQVQVGEAAAAVEGYALDRLVLTLERQAMR